MNAETRGIVLGAIKLMDLAMAKLDEAWLARQENLQSGDAAQKNHNCFTE